MERLSKEIIAKAGEIIRKKSGEIGGYCVLALLDNDGFPTASMIEVSKSDGINWITFYTYLNSNKVKRIEKCNRASVCFGSLDPYYNYNITLVGTVGILTDPDIKKEIIIVRYLPSKKKGVVMKKIIKTTLAVTGFTAIAAFCFGGCGKVNEDGGKSEVRAPLSREEIASRSFSELFDATDVKNIPSDVFTLVGEDFAVLTAGDPSHYNSMVAGWGGWGVMFGKPSTFLMLRSSRYTLELIRKGQGYTMAFFDSEFKDDVMAFGKQSGRDSDAKMKNTRLTAVKTPAGNMVFKEARLIIECALVQVTTVAPDDFYTDFSKKFIAEAFAETKEYHKVVLGEITNVWIRK